MREGDYDLAGFAVGAAERGHLLPRGVAPGDAVLGLASSGVHSNGFSLVRRVVEASGLAWDAPAPFDPEVSLGQALMTPTRIYVRSVLALHRAGLLKAAAHITGGGLPGNLPRVLPEGTVAVLEPTGRCRRCSAGWRAPAGSRRRRCCGCSTAASAWRWWSPIADAATELLREQRRERQRASASIEAAESDRAAAGG